MFVRTKCALPNVVRASLISATVLQLFWHQSIILISWDQFLMKGCWEQLRRKKLVTKSGFCGFPLNEFVLSALPASSLVVSTILVGKSYIKKKTFDSLSVTAAYKKLLTSQSSRHPFALISIADYRTYPDKRLSVALYHCHMAGRAHCYGVTVACQRWNINMIEPGPYQLFHLSHTNTNTYVMLL